MKRVYVLGLIGLMLFTGCTNKDKSIILSEDTSNESNLKYEVTVNEIDYKVGKNSSLVPSYYIDDELFLWVANSEEGYNISEVTEIERLRYNLNSKGIIKEDTITVSSLDNNSRVANRYYKGMELQENGNYEYIADSVTNKKFEYKPAAIDQEIDLDEGENIAYGIWDIIGDTGFYYRVGHKFKGNDTSNGVCLVEMYDFINGKTYKYSDSYIDNEESGKISIIDYSYKLDKFFGLNYLGEIYELELVEDEIQAKVIYKIPLKDDEIFSYADTHGRDFDIFNGTKFIYAINDKSGVSKEVRVLDLVSLKEEVLNYKLNNDIENPIIRLGSDLVLLNIKSNQESNDYILLDLASENMDTINKLSIDKDSYIVKAIGNNDGTRFAVTIHTKDNKFKELIEFKIEKLG